jgi:uncharacterized membrane protein
LTVLRTAHSLRHWKRPRLVPLLVVVVASGVSSPGCDGDSPSSERAECPGVTQKACPDSVPSYASDIAPIIEARCEHCHAPDNDQGLWLLSDQESVNEWSDTILRQIRSCSQPPPDSGYSLSAEERQMLEAWLVCGAPNN